MYFLDFNSATFAIWMLASADPLGRRGALAALFGFVASSALATGASPMEGTWGGADAQGRTAQITIVGKAADELVRVKPHRLPTARTVDAIVLPPERDAGVVGCNEAAV